MKALSRLAAEPPSPRARAAVRELDWQRTKIGDPRHWPTSWVSAMESCLTGEEASLIALGPQLELFCNDPFADQFNNGEIFCFGRRLRLVGGDVHFDPLCRTLRHVARCGQPVLSMNKITLSGRGVTKGPERHVAASLVPLRDSAGKCSGVSTVMIDVTNSSQAVHRLAKLHELMSLHERRRAQNVL